MVNVTYCITSDKEMYYACGKEDCNRLFQVFANGHTELKLLKIKLTLCRQTGDM